MKCSTFPPKPTWLPLAVQFLSKPSSRFLQAIVLIDFASSKGLYLCWKPAASMYNEISLSQSSFESSRFDISVAHVSLRFKPSGVRTLFLREW